MNEKQSIQVDNWADTTLNRMQQFFFHSKHCDLTLRFSNNTALTVHRLILRMYTDYFDQLVVYCSSKGSVQMPRNLQSNVVLPIIKFFYTGSIEFEDHQLSALLEAAKLIGVPILIELLELHQKRIRNQTKVTTLTTLTEKKSVIHPLFINRDITVNVLDKKHKTSPQAIDMPVVKKVKVSEKKGKKKKSGDTNISNEDSQVSDLINSAIRNADAMDGPLRFSLSATIPTRPGTPFGQISYDNMVDNSFDVHDSDDVLNVEIRTPEKTAVISVTPESLTPIKIINQTPKKSFQEYIDFPVHELDNDQFFASDNINLTDLTNDADNLGFIELSSDSDLFEIIELDY